MAHLPMAFVLALVMLLLASCSGPSKPGVTAGQNVKGVDGALVSVLLDDNAALWYWAAFSEFDEYSDEEFDALLEALSEEGDDDAARALHDEAEQVLHACMFYVPQAVEHERCVFAIDRSAGIGALLPHVSKMKRLSWLLLTDAGRIVDDSEADMDLVVERIGQLLTVADHIHQDHVFIGNLVGREIFENALEGIELGMESDWFSIDQQRQLSVMLKRVHVVTREAYVEAVEGEREITVPWFRREFAGAEGYARLCEDIPELASQDGEDFDPQDFDGVLDRLDQAYEDLADAAQSGDDDAVARVSEGIFMGGYKYLGFVFLGAQQSHYMKCVALRQRWESMCLTLTEDE